MRTFPAFRSNARSDAGLPHPVKKVSRYLRLVYMTDHSRILTYCASSLNCLTRQRELGGMDAKRPDDIVVGQRVGKQYSTLYTAQGAWSRYGRLRVR